MIVPNLMVSDMPRAIAFYGEVFGMHVSVLVAADRSVSTEGDGADAVFATLEGAGGQLMLQLASSISEELPQFAGRSPEMTGTIYLRGVPADEVAGRAPASSIVKGPLNQWYGMREVYVSDPDGYVICAGAPEGPPPQ